MGENEEKEDLDSDAVASGEIRRSGERENWENSRKIVPAIAGVRDLGQKKTRERRGVGGGMYLFI